MQGPLPYLLAFPSTWYADDAVPKTNPAGKLSRVRFVFSPTLPCALSAMDRTRRPWRSRTSNGGVVSMLERQWREAELWGASDLLVLFMETVQR